jgi:hypothetical protein
MLLTLLESGIMPLYERQYLRHPIYGHQLW